MSGMPRLVPAAVVLAAAAVVSVVLVPPPTAEAKPAYSQKEGKPCGFCHTNPRGGGPRNEKGEEYQRDGFKFAAAPAGKGYGEDEAFKSQVNADRYEFARAALQNEHYADAFRRLAELKLREDKKGTGYQKAINLEAIVEGKGRDLVRAAKEAIQGGKAAEAADALARVELEFKGRDAAKEVAARRAELLKLPGGKEADAKARIDAPQRVRFLDARMKEVEGDDPAAMKILEDMLTKWPDGRFATDAKTKLDELKTAAAAPAMGG